MDITWEATAAIGQVAGALATFAAVVLSLQLARRASRPQLKVCLKELLLIFEEESEPVLMFSVTNVGERMAEIRTLGWHTGWLSKGPEWLRTCQAIQTFDGRAGMKTPPYKLEPGEEISSYVSVKHLLEHAERFGKTGPLFTRKTPWGVFIPRAKVFAYTADGYLFRGDVDKKALAKLAEAEIVGRKAAQTEMLKKS